MYRVPYGGAETHLVTSVVLALFALVVAWLGFLGFPPQRLEDFEACVERLEASTASNDDHGASMSTCSARFAGRRKPGGGYTYYDFMQGRSFDIAGPNPTAEERKQIDGDYMAFLDAQRREAVAADFVRRQNEQRQADLESDRQPGGPPLALTARNPLSPVAKRPVDRSKSGRCEDGSLSCSWSKLSAVVKNALASSPKTKP